MVYYYLRHVHGARHYRALASHVRTTGPIGETEMKCPVCAGIDLKIAERQGVEIDYCPECRGVWLDRGELDKIIERSDAQTAAYTQPQTQIQPQFLQTGHTQQQHGKQHHDDHRYGQNGQYRKKSWISELFD